MYKYPNPISKKQNQVDFENKKTLFGLPSNVKFCKKCIISNQRPNSEVEYKHNILTKKKLLNLIMMVFVMHARWHQKRKIKLIGF